MMNDQTSPTADGQLPDPAAAAPRDPFAAPLDAQGLEPVPPGPVGSAGGGDRAFLAKTAKELIPDAVSAGIIAAAGLVVGILAALAWYRFSPTVWLSVPANVAGQITTNIDQYALLASPEAKGIASVDGYFAVITAIGGAVLGVAAFLLARRGKDGTLLGGWVGVLVGGFLASTLTAALGRWISMPDPITVLHAINGNHDFHAPVALRAQGLYVVAPLVGTVVYMTLMLIFTKTPPVDWATYQERANQGQQGYFSQDDPYGGGMPPMPAMPPTGGDTPAPWPTAKPDGQNHQNGQNGQNRQNREIGS
jgi:hypothetical protein